MEKTNPVWCVPRGSGGRCIGTGCNWLGAGLPMSPRMCGPIASPALQLGRLPAIPSLVSAGRVLPSTNRSTDHATFPGCSMLVLAQLIGYAPSKKKKLLGYAVQFSTLRFPAQRPLFQRFSSVLKNPAPQVTEFGAGLNAFYQ